MQEVKNLNEFQPNKEPGKNPAPEPIIIDKKITREIVERAVKLRLKTVEPILEILSTDVPVEEISEKKLIFLDAWGYHLQQQLGMTTDDEKRIRIMLEKIAITIAATETLQMMLNEKQ